MSCYAQKKSSSSPWMTVIHGDRWDSHGFVTPSMGLSIVSSRRFPPFWGGQETPRISAASLNERVVSSRRYPKHKLHRWHLGGWLVEGGCQPTPPPKKTMGEYRFNKKHPNKIEMEGSLGLTCVFSRDVLAWRFVVGFLDVCWLLGCVRYSLLKIPLLSKTSPLHPRKPNMKGFLCSNSSRFAGMFPGYVGQILTFSKYPWNGTHMGCLQNNDYSLKGNRTFFLSENQLVAVSLADQRSELRGQYSNYCSNSRACAPLKLNMEPEN